MQSLRWLKIDFVLSKSTNPQAYYYQCSGKCLLGYSDGVSQDLDSAKKNGFIDDKDAAASRYPQIEKLCETSEEDFGPASALYCNGRG